MITNAGGFFQRQLKIKKDELYFVLRESIISGLFEGLVEKYDQESFSLKSKAESEFACDSPTYLFLEAPLLVPINIPKNDPKFVALRAAIGEETEELKELLELLFDVNVFEMLKADKREKDVQEMPAEIMIIETALSMKEAGLLERLEENLTGSYELKFPLMVAKLFRFFKFVMRKNKVASPSSLHLASLICRRTAIALQRLCLVLKVSDKASVIAPQIIEKVQENLKFSIERLIQAETRALSDELSTVTGDLRDFLQQSNLDYLNMVFKYDLQMRMIVERVSEFLSVPSLLPQVNAFSEYLVAIFVGRVEKNFELNVSQNRQLEDLTKVDVDSEVILNSEQSRSAYSTFILGKKQSLELFVAFEPFLKKQDMSISVNTIPLNGVVAKFFALRNKVYLSLSELVDRKLVANFMLKDTMIALKDPYWSAVAGFFGSQLTFLPNTNPLRGIPLPTFARGGEKFWVNSDSLDFYETSLISLENLCRIFASARDALFVFWQNAPATLRASISQLLGVRVEEDPGTELMAIATAVQTRNKNSLPRVRETNFDQFGPEEGFAISVGSLFKLRDLAVVFFLHAKRNFDLMLQGFFDEARKQLNSLQGGARAQFRTSQLREFENLLVSFDRFHAKYINDPTTARCFVINSLEVLFKGLAEFVFDNRSFFVSDPRTLRNYYLSFSSCISSSKVFHPVLELAEVLSQGYEQLTPLMVADDLELARKIANDQRISQDGLIFTAVTNVLSPSSKSKL